MAGEGVDLTKRDVPPDAEAVSHLHTNADTDTRAEAIHHTLGPGSSQATAGDHKHRGGDSSLLLDGVVISGSRGGNVALLGVIQALVALGVTDSTTA